MKAPYEYRNKIFDVGSCYLKVDNNGDVGFSSKGRGLLHWGDISWRCGYHNHWLPFKGEMRVVEDFSALEANE
jgi:hypothetical protein